MRYEILSVYFVVSAREDKMRDEHGNLVDRKSGIMNILRARHNDQCKQPTVMVGGVVDMQQIHCRPSTSKCVYPKSTITVRETSSCPLHHR